MTFLFKQQSRDTLFLMKLTIAKQFRDKKQYGSGEIIKKNWGLRFEMSTTDFNREKNWGWILRSDNSNDIKRQSTTATIQETIYHRFWAIKAVHYMYYILSCTLAVHFFRLHVQEEVYETVWTIQKSCISDSRARSLYIICVTFKAVH